MKSLFFSLVFVLFGFVTYAQEASVQSAEDFKKSVVDGKITMTLPAEITKENVSKYSAYYTAFFTTEFDEQNRQIKFNMVNNDGNQEELFLDSYQRTEFNLLRLVINHFPWQISTRLI